MAHKPVFIKKASGESQLFSEEKLRRSLQKSRAAAGVVDEIVETVTADLKEGRTTREIYDRAHTELRRRQRGLAARYSLKRAIMQMGPSGHPFELFVAELIKMKGYSVKVAQIVPGRCVSHEVDVIAEKDEEQIMVECKFHNQPGLKSDVKISLYVQARFEDIRPQGFHQPWLVTNTQLTSDAIRYAECVGMKAVAWNYLGKDSLQSWVETAGLHPVTCLTTLSGTQKKYLVDSGVILCRDIHKNLALLDQIRVSEKQQADLFAEIQQLCGVG